MVRPRVAALRLDPLVMVVAALAVPAVRVAVVLSLLSNATTGVRTVPPQPSFISQPETIRAKQGETVVLPCEISHLGPFVVVWKRQRRVLSAREAVVVRDARFSLVDGYNLRITAVQPADQSSYTCALDTEPLSELTHRLEVLFGPVVSAQPSSGVLVVKLGETAEMSCQASGNPPPRIAWRKQGGTLPSGAAEHEAGEYTVTGATRQMAGVYQCVAENGVGNPSTASVRLQVQYPPEVEVAKSVVYTGEGFGAELVCVVFAQPEAEVRWEREGALLEPSHHRSSSSGGDEDGTRYTLAIDSVTLADFGTYSCHATNSLGTAGGQIQISGTPERAQVTSSAMGAAPDSYQLSWTVRSFSPVLEYKVAYRQSKQNSSSASSGGWREVLVPHIGGDVVDAHWHRQSIPLTGLAPAATYDVHVQARNRHGWSAVSDMVHFSTLAKGEALESRRFNAASRSSSSLPPVILTVALLISNAFQGFNWV
ncbi:protein amalgam-like isoform X1 [Amphibalanus amphitrite]|uniref:protein amalgam-like isoform X1 n=1 Tax=Amphibalanus amphitrite TaxID=1232801 RepID=UPI001C902276|nr:protein amalgam-like isoform X1 [Amphibalanus amphitrite]